MQEKDFDPEELLQRFPELPKVPVMCHKKFSDEVGLPEGVILGWCNRGYVDVIKIGKHNLVNLVELHYRCTEFLRIKD